MAQNCRPSKGQARLRATFETGEPAQSGLLFLQHSTVVLVFSGWNTNCGQLFRLAEVFFAFGAAKTAKTKHMFPPA